MTFYKNRSLKEETGKKKKKMKNSALLCLPLFSILVRKMNIEVSIKLSLPFLLALLAVTDRTFPDESDISDGAL